MLPVDEIEARRIAQGLVSSPPEQGHPILSNALQWRMQSGKVIIQAGTGPGITRIREIMASAKIASQPDEFGDFQTPDALAAQACTLLSNRGIDPASLLEPTCGVGNFLLAALVRFPKLTTALGVDINKDYVDRVKKRLCSRSDADKVKVLQENFFNVDWADVLRDLPEPILVVGNPPWVTNSTLGALGSSNLPQKSNFRNFNGMEALTGKSNFDISEWMLIKLIEMLAGRRATMAMLCKTAVARKVLVHAWKNDIGMTDAEIHPIDAAASFGAAVDACLLVCSLSSASPDRDCRVYRRLGETGLAATIGYHNGQLVADVSAYDRWKHLAGEEVYKWRSGVKHDCSKVMELRKEGKQYRNGLDELVHLEDAYLFPMLKSSEITNGRCKEPTRWMLVPQKTVGDETSVIRFIAPQTWEYLQKQGVLLDRRASSIYRNRPRFSVFGVGDYTFAPWKVAISGFYKQLRFATVGPYSDRPVVLDDTSYFVACQSKQEAGFIADLLNSQPAREFFSAFVFWDSKRPITIELLRRLDLSAVAHELGSEDTLAKFQVKKRKDQPHRQSKRF